MARLLCKCGETLSNTQAPNDIELRVYTDREWDEIIQHDSIDPLTIPFPKHEVWRCPKCERIHVFDGDKVIKRYVLETE
jgi:hypothetical protein